MVFSPQPLGNASLLKGVALGAALALSTSSVVIGLAWQKAPKNVSAHPHRVTSAPEPHPPSPTPLHEETSGDSSKLAKKETLAELSASKQTAPTKKKPVQQARPGRLPQKTTKNKRSASQEDSYSMPLIVDPWDEPAQNTQQKPTPRKDPGIGFEVF